MTKLDHSRPYGKIIGPGPGKYAQDGKTFDRHGREIDSRMEVLKSEIRHVLDEANVAYWLVDASEAALDLIVLDRKTAYAVLLRPLGSTSQEEAKFQARWQKNGGVALTIENVAQLAKALGISLRPKEE
ncbi:MAG: hypothetical protein JSU72_13150 [Deltaproteobacteria bacterium]|nr:MAG: hypothetical protein JSU72_13150 [Deltaproteobacteria bacterium]